MLYQSILGVHKNESIDPDDIIMPKFFYDLNLDQIIQDIIEEHKNYDLRRFYYYKAEKEDIPYRFEVLRDFEQVGIYQSIVDFGIGMRHSKQLIENIEKTSPAIQKQKWKLDSANCYINAVIGLHKRLMDETMQSKGLLAFYHWLDAFIKQESFQKLKDDTIQLSNEFNAMKFNIQIKRDRIIIEQGYLEEDYCKQLLDTFHEATVEEHFYQQNPFPTIELSEIEEAVLNVLKKSHSKVFEALSEFDKKYQEFIEVMLSDFELESQFYISFLLFCEKMKEMNFHFCYPVISEKLDITDGYDLALAKKNASMKREVVFNDSSFDQKEQFFVVTGPNQGGKTTFARAIGQILYFGSMGLKVPAKKASFPAFDGIYTHFAVEENVDSGAGKLKEELLRVKAMMDGVSGNSFIIINEIFTSATSYDAFIMGKKVLNYFMDKQCLGVYVTHIHELTKDDERIVSLVATLKSEDSNIRTFKIKRRVADGRSYANTIVEKYHMTYQEIKERIRQ